MIRHHASPCKAGVQGSTAPGPYLGGAKEALMVVRLTVTDFKEENRFSFVHAHFLLSPSERLCPEGDGHTEDFGEGCLETGS